MLVANTDSSAVSPFPSKRAACPARVARPGSEPEPMHRNKELLFDHADAAHALALLRARRERPRGRRSRSGAAPGETRRQRFPELAAELREGARPNDFRTRCGGWRIRDSPQAPAIPRSLAAPFSIPRTGTFLRALLLVRLSLRYLRDQLLGDGVAEGIEILHYHDERAGAADDVVAIIVCKPA
jgi:hypothetical protein